MRAKMQKLLLLVFGFVATSMAIAACGELTGPKSPETPINVTATLTGTNTVLITWARSPQSDGVISYNVLRNGTKIGESTTLSYTDTQVAEKTTYKYTVSANCTSGVLSDPSPESAAATVTTIDVTPPRITSVSPLPNQTGVSTFATVTATFSEAMTAATVTTATFQLRNAANTVVTATLSYNATSRVATLTPSQALANSATYTATITGGSAGVKDSAGNAMAANRVWSFSTAAAPTTPGALTIFSASSAPTTYATTDGSAVELGLKFRSDVAGTVTGVRFYKGTRTTGTHTGTLWSSTGTRLATATFTGETASGWQQVTFSTPVSITANTVYVVSYHSDIGNYAYTHNTFANAGVDNGPLHALRAGVSGGNGVFRYGGAVFPNQSFNSSNYWVDVVFVPR